MPKREDDYWASQKEELRYCSKHKRYYRADVGCQLCWMEEHQERRSTKLRECPVCHEMSLFQTGDNLFECLNLKCSKYQKRQSIEPHKEQKTNVTGAQGAQPGAASPNSEPVSDEESMRMSSESGRKTSLQAKEPGTDVRSSSNKSIQTNEAGQSSRRKNIKPVISGAGLPKWTIALLFVFALSIVGTGISLYAGTFILFWIMFGFSAIFSIEKWFSYYTRKHKWIGKLYRLILNLSILSLLGLLIWSGTRLFSNQFTYSSLVGSLIFLAEFIFFIWMWRVISRNSWRWPSMKLTVFSLICLSVVFAFAGVQPLSTYKDEMITRIDHTITAARATPTTAEPSRPLPTQTQITPKPSQTQVTTTTATVNDYAKMFNQFRQSNGLQPLMFTDDLNRIAALRLQELKTDYSHHSAGNYNQHLGENIAMSTGALNNSSALNMWENSPGHRANMLDSTYRYTGYAIYDGGFWGGAYAVQVFSEFETVNGVPQLPPGWYWSK